MKTTVKLNNLNIKIFKYKKYLINIKTISMSVTSFQLYNI